MEYQVIMEGLCFRYSDQEEMVLRDINLKVKKGEFVVIIGHNGSGKSTLAKHINALLVPSLGKVEVMGMDTRDPAKAWK